MKKALSILALLLALLLALFLVACGPTYDFSSEEALKKSIYAQAEKEGVSEADAKKIIQYMLPFARQKYMDLKTEPLMLLPKHLNGNSLKALKEEMAPYIEKYTKLNESFIIIGGSYNPEQIKMEAALAESTRLLDMEGIEAELKNIYEDSTLSPMEIEDTSDMYRESSTLKSGF